MRLVVNLSKFNPNQTQLRAKGSSLAIDIFHDDANEFSFYVFNRRTHSIIGHYKIPLLQHCRDAMIDVSPIISKKHQKRIDAEKKADKFRILPQYREEFIRYQMRQ